MNQQRLYRSRNNKVFAGVCGGLAEYFDVDPVIIRVIFVLLFLFGGSGFLLYIAAIFIVPKRPYEPVEQQNAAAAPVVEPHSDAARNWFGAILVVVGVIILLANLEVFHFMWFVEDAFEYIFPVLLIILGMALIYYKQSRPEPFTPSVSDVSGGAATSASAEPMTGPRTTPQFRRSSTDKKMFGVCGGLAHYFGIDSSILRMLYVVLCVASFGTGILLYIIIALVVPYDNAAQRGRV